MNTKTIQTQQGLIVWDSFRGSFTMLMNTVPHLIECRVESKVDKLKPILYLSFRMFDTNGFQEETREAKVTSPIFEMEFNVEEVNDNILVTAFDIFYKHYIANKDRLVERAKMNQEISSAIDNLVTKLHRYE